MPGELSKLRCIPNAGQDAIEKRYRLFMVCGMFRFIICVMSLAGCAISEDYQRPVLEPPASFRNDIETTEGSLPLSESGWWELFHDENLHALIRKGLLENKDLRMAIARVREVRAQLTVTQADQLPQLDGHAQFERNQTSGAPARQYGISGSDIRPGPHTSQWVAAGVLNYEIDLWGKLRRTSEAAAADLLAKKWAKHSVQLMLVSAIVQAYFELQALDLELTISQRTLDTRQKSLELITLRKLMGQGSTLDIRRAEQEVARTHALLPGLERQIGQKEHQLSILVGQNPSSIIRGAALSEQTLPPEVPAGLPSSLLERRPDIIEAEQNLVAANARIGVAKAAFFPQISLTGNWGAHSLSFSDLFIGAARVWSLGPTITVPIFNAGRNRANLEIRKAQQEQALIAYEQTIQQAFLEVDDALLAHQKNRETRLAQEQLVKVSREAFQLAQLEYLNGKATYLDVLTSQRTMFEAEISLAQTNRDQLVTVVQLYKALGGGWAPEPLAHKTVQTDTPS